jgi:hypothetical protein
MHNFESVLINTKPYMTQKIIESANQCAIRLLDELPHKSNLSSNRVLLAYGGGKDSSYMVAYLRYIQAIIYKEHRDTFYLRISTNRHAGMSKAVMDNIHRVYSALEIYNDDYVECLLVDGMEIQEFQKDIPFPQAIRHRNRVDMLMNGHRFQADARSTFCNACNLSMINSFGIAASYKGGVDIIITGDSTKEQTAYIAWSRHLSNIFNIKRKKKRSGFSSFLETMNGVSQGYFRNLHGDNNIAPEHSVTFNLDRDPTFFNIYQNTEYSAGEHWELLTEFLQFNFDDLMFSFSESDCGNPNLMAHVRGLRAKSLQRKNYSDGIKEYVKFGLDIMRKKEFPEHLIDIMASRYIDEPTVQKQYYLSEKYAKDAFDVNTEQLICMIYSPFTERGKNLDLYIQQENPTLNAEKIHKLLRNGIDDSSQQRKIIETISGLSLASIRQCYNNTLVSNHLDKNKNSPLSHILRLDPHKDIIKVFDKNRGIYINEIISGR